MLSPYLVENRYLAVKRCKHGLFMYNRNDAFVGRGLDLYGEWCDFEIQLLRQVIRLGDTVLDAAGPDQVGEGNGMRADSGAGVDAGVAQPDKLPKQLDLKIAPLAVEVEAAADKRVVAVVHEQAVLAPLDRQIPVFDEVGRQHPFPPFA